MAKQEKISEKQLMIMIGFLSSFIPASTDLYLPALPTMAEKLSTTPEMVNMTLTLFFICFGFATLFWGPFSDKYGRKPILLIGTVLYTISSFCCAFSPTIYALIVCRVFQAIAGGAIVAVSGAIIKDSFEGEKRDKMFALNQSMAMLAPIISPVVGAIIFKFVSWHGLFVALGLIGVIALGFVFFFSESIETKSDDDVLESVKNLFVVLKNREFFKCLMIFSMLAISVMAFVSSSSYIYVNEFGLNEQVFSFFFAFNAMFLVVAPLMSLRLSKKYSKRKIISISFVIIALSGLLILNFGSVSPFVFALLLVPATFFNGLVKPIGVSLMFSMHKKNAGAVSSVVGFTNIFFGFLGMMFVSVNIFETNLTLIAVLNIIVGLICFVFWKMFSKNY